MRQEIAQLKEFVGREMSGKPVLTVLEAGCGAASWIRFEQPAYVIGIDISAKQLERNKSLDEKILGDIQYYDFPRDAYDVIVCCDVLEHLPRPELALQKFASAVKMDGLIVLKLPNVLSFKGLVTKCLPHPLHVVAYRYLHKGKTEAADTGPFKTFLRFSIRPNAIKRFANVNGLRTVYFDTYDTGCDEYLQRKKAAFLAYHGMKAIFEFASFGHICDSEFIIVMRRGMNRGTCLFADREVPKGHRSEAREIVVQR